MNRLKYGAYTFVGLLATAVIAIAAFTTHFARDLPSLDALMNYKPRLVTQVFDRNDKVIAEYSTERRITLASEEIPEVIANAFLAAEDDEFFTHRGVNPITILRAAIRNFQAGHTVQGGSTITQQVAKSMLLTPERSYKRKIKEMILAFRIERALSKKEILSLYLNQIFLGNGAYGVEAASLTYFGKRAQEITIPEAAILGGLPRAPSRDNPLNNPSVAKKRQRYVLGRMLDSRRISRSEYEEALQAELKIRNRMESPTPIPYASEYVRRYLMQKYGAETVYEGGLKVYTTLSLDATVAAQDAIKAGLLQLDKRIGLRKPTKTLHSPSEQEKYLKAEHDKIVGLFYDYKLLTTEGQLVSPLKGNEPTPLELGKNYQAVVTGKDPTSRKILIQVGNRRGSLRREDYAWAGNADPDEVYPDKVIRNPFTELKRGDVITVQPRVLEIGKEEFLLEQEPLVQGALVSYDIPTGALTALVGGYDYNVTKSEFNRAIQAVRQPGSTFKPILYACALDNGLTPASILVDSPIVYRDVTEQSEVEKVWRPDNYGERFYGDTRMRLALTFSRNIPTIKLLQYLKVHNVIEYARRLGISSPLAADLSMALGSSGVTLDELTRAYAIFANQGNRLNVHFIRKIEDRQGVSLEQHQIPNKPENVIPESTAFLMTSMLKSVVEQGTATVVKPLGRPTAGKTGTTNDYKDALFVGYVPQLVSGVWVGFDEDRPLGRNETGNRSAAPIWLQYMQMATANIPAKDFEAPPSVVQIPIDADTGDVPTPKTKRRVPEYFAVGTVPGQRAAPPSGSANPAPTPATLNRTKVITGNPDLPAVDRPSGNPDDVNTDELYRNDL